MLDHTVAPAPSTTLVAEPVVARVAPTRVTLGMLEARLTDGSGAPLAGEILAFTAGDQQLCAAVTDSDGVGRCANLVTTLQAVLGLGYHVTFAGDPDYVAATARGPIVIVLNVPIF
jgi:hypothetical protein